MRVVVLYTDEGDALLLCAPERVLCGKIVRMQIARERPRMNVEQAFKVPDLSGIGVEGLHVFEISDVLTQKSIAAAGEAEAGLLLRSAGENGQKRTIRADWEGHIAPRASGEVFRSVEHPAEGIVTAGLDVAVMQQEAVRNAVQSIYRLPVIRQHRGVGEIGAGHDQHVDILSEKQYMQRRIRQHHAHISVFADMAQAVSFLFQKYDRAAKALEDLSLAVRQLTDLCRAVRIAAHDGKGLFVALFSPAQGPRDLGIVTAAGKMDTAEALDRHDLTGLQGLARKLDSVAFNAPAFTVKEKHLRPAVRAAVRLRVIAPVFNIMVFPLAVRTHGKGAHGGPAPVIGHIPDDGKARAAVGAVDERITVTAVVGIG